MVRARGLTRVAPSIGPTRGSIVIGSGPRRLVVPGKGVGDQRLRRRLRRLLLLRPHDSSPVSAALAAVSSTLAERRPVVAGAPDLSALAGARAGTIGVTLSTRKQKST
jgi:hypothetical protein